MKNVQFVKCWENRKDGVVVVVIPKNIRKNLGITAGDTFLITYDKQNRLILKKVDQTL